MHRSALGDERPKEAGGNRGAPRLGKILLVTAAGLSLLMVSLVVVLTNTNWGREQVRTLVLAQLAEAVEGRIEIHRLEGNLLRRIHLRNVSVVDSRGRAFLEAEELSFGYSITGLLRQRIQLADLRLGNALVVLDDPPGEDWNFIRIFVSPNDEGKGTESGWGDWVDLRGLRISETFVMVRMGWDPEAESEEHVRQALAGERRERVIPVPGGYQRIMELRGLDAMIPRILLAHPEESDIVLEVANLSATALPFRPPGAQVRDLSGVVRLEEGAIQVQNLEIRLPYSHLLTEGRFDFESGQARFELQADPISLADLRFLHPPLPTGVEGQAHVRISHLEDATHIRMDEIGFQVGEGELQGELDMVSADSLRVDQVRVTFEGIDTRLLDESIPALDLPIHGLLSGSLEAESSGEDAHAGGRTGRSSNAPTMAGGTDLEGWVRLDDEAGRSSRAFAQGRIYPSLDPARIRMEGLVVGLDPLDAHLVRAVLPGVPLDGVIEASATLDGPVTGPLHLDGLILHRDPVVGLSRISFAGGLDLDGEVRLTRMEVGLDPIRLAALSAEPVPPETTLSGSVHLDGAPMRLLEVRSDVSVDAPNLDVSRISTRGGIGLGEEVVFHDFQVSLSPFEVGLVRGVLGDLRVGGIVEATAVLDGSPRLGLGFGLDLTHEEDAQRSRLEAAGAVATGSGGSVTADLELHGISLATVGRFVPEAELEGVATGYIHLKGTPNDLLVRTELGLPDAASLEAVGVLDIAHEEPSYDLRLSVTKLNLAALSGRVPETTSIDGAGTLAGRGTAPRSMEARLTADFADTAPLEPRLLHTAAHLEEALLVIDSLRWRSTTSEMDIEGSFGLGGSRRGEFNYRIAVDSLHLLTPFLSLDAGTIEPRPAVLRASLAEREAELKKALREAEVEFLATGRAPSLPEPGDTLRIVGVRTDALAGAARASGRVRGNVTSSHVEGTLQVEDLVAGGHRIQGAEAAYSILGVGEGKAEASVEIHARDLLLQGFAYDSLSLRSDYKGNLALGPASSHTATSSLRVVHDSVRLATDMTFALDSDRYEVRVDQLALDVGEVAYRTPHVARIRWSDQGMRAEDVVLESDQGALLRADGELPAEGGGELDIRVEALPIEHIWVLLQERPGIRGRLRLDAPIRGTTRQPTFDGEVGLTDVEMDGHPLPRARARFSYANQELTADASLEEPEESILTLEAILPIDLGLMDAADPRFLPGPLQVDVRLSEWPLDNVAAMTNQLEGVQGWVTGHYSLSGTFDAPEHTGALELWVPSATVVPLGLRIQDMSGALSLVDEALTVDSLVVYSQGPLRVTGDLDLRQPREPAFNLEVQARDARIINRDDARIRVDADLTISGPFDGVQVDGTIRSRNGIVRIPETREMATRGPLDLEDPATFERVDQFLVEARDALIQPSPLLEQLTVAVDLQVDRDFWIRSREANVELHTPPATGPLALRMNGLTARNLAIDGTISTDRGEYEFMGRRFSIARGSVTFTDETEPDPLIRLTAEQEVQLPGREAFDIRVILDGTLTDLEVELESSAQPPLSQTDLLSLVVFGREAGSLLQQPGSSLTGQGSSGGALVGDVAARATQQFTTVGVEALLNELETETARALRLDVLHIQPTDSPAEIFTGRAVDVLRGTEIQAGRYLTSRLFVAGQARPTFVHPGARVEYLTDTGYIWRASWRPRFLPAVPTLAPRAPDRASVLGIFLFREWRF